MQFKLLEEKLRSEILEIGRRMWQRNYVAANDGNISVRLDDERYLITPSGVSKGFMDAGSILVVDREGNILEGTGKASSEMKMHLMIYQLRSEIQAVVHAQPIFATTFAAAECALDIPILTEVAQTIGNIPLAPYATPSTDEVPESIRPLIPRHDAILLSHHGVVTYGKSLIDAYDKMERVEHYAAILFNLMTLNRVETISPENLVKLQEVKERLGL
ncbi:MAG TPA: class II aldolase/adducin family protein [Bacillota bacterium]|nr:class II aldolase/adducin family protein [Bacillota bacterium]